MPNRPGTKGRNVRVPDELWQAATAKAREKGEDVSTVIRRALERYVRSK